MFYWFLVFIISTTAAKYINPSHEWKQFQIKHDKIYATQEEENYRRTVFLKNLRRIQEHNELYDKGLESYKLGVNKFADTTHDEFVELTSNRPDTLHIDKVEKPFKTAGLRSIPSSFDWRDYGAITPVKNQKDCQSCYAFTALGCLESFVYLKYNITLNLSEQNIVDCSWSTNNHGCKGGYMDRVYKYIQSYGVMNETSYPYIGEDKKCFFNDSKRVLKVKGYEWVDKSEEALKEAVATIGPIGTSLDYKELQFYDSGIFAPKQEFERLTHGVIVIGYGSENGTDYWIIKNSYGTEWGENGFGRIRMNTTDSLGLTRGAIYPIIE